MIANVVRERALLLRTCDANGRSYNDFQWPLEVGAVATAPDWQPTRECGNGLHGLLWGEGDGSLLSWADDALWLVVEAEEYVVIGDGEKAKCPRATVRFVGDRLGATAFLAANGGAGKAVVGSTLTGGDRSTLTGGYGSTLTGGDGSTLTGGYGSTLTGRFYDTARALYHTRSADVGEDGIEPNVAYQLNTEGQFVRVEV